MQLILNDHSAFLGKRSEIFYVRMPGKPEQEFAAENIEQIIVAKASSISAGAVHLAMEKEIDIVYLDWRGMPVARVYPCCLGGTTLTRRLQLEACSSPVSAQITKALISAKIKNQGYLLKALAKSRDNEAMNAQGDLLLQHSKKISSLGTNLKKIRGKLLGLEGYAANVYWESLSAIIPINGRNKEGSDLVNCLLNYGYGVLYSEVEKACVLAGLDPYLGFFHSDRYGKPSMVLDLIEPFRPVIVDRAVVTLYAHRKLDEMDSISQGGAGKRLSKQGRDKILSAVMERLHTSIALGDSHVTLQDVLLRQSRLIVRKILGDHKDFRPFIYRW